MCSTVFSVSKLCSMKVSASGKSTFTSTLSNQNNSLLQERNQICLTRSIFQRQIGLALIIFTDLTQRISYKLFHSFFFLIDGCRVISFFHVLYSSISCLVFLPFGISVEQNVLLTFTALHETSPLSTLASEQHMN